MWGWQSNSALMGHQYLLHTMTSSTVLTSSSQALMQASSSSFSPNDSAAPSSYLDKLMFHSDSVDWPAVADIGRLGSSLFLSADLFVYTDVSARTLNFVHMDTDKVVTIGSHGHGPGEFQVIGGTFRDNHGNIVVDDWAALRATVVDSHGNVVKTVAYDVSMLNGGPGVPRLIGMANSGLLIVRDSDPMVMPRPDGLYRPSIWFVGMDTAQSTVIAQGHGQEVVRVNLSADGGSFAFRSRAVPFAHELFSAYHNDKLYIADTSADSVIIITMRDGAVQGIPLPPARTVSEQDLASWRDREIARIQELSNAPSFFDASDHIRWVRGATGNSFSSRIGGMFVDVSGRLWVQRYAMPTDSTVYWEQWEQGPDAPAAVVRLSEDEQLLDALGDMVVTSTTDDLGVNSIAVWQLAGES